MNTFFKAHSSPVHPSVSIELPHITEEDAENCYNKSNQHGDIYFSDKNIQKYYEKFRIDSVTPWTIMLWLFLSLFLIANAFAGFFVINNYYPSDLPFVKCLLVGRIVVCALIILNCYLIMRGVRKDSSRGDLFNYISVVTNLTDFIIVVSALINAVVLVSRSFLGECGDHDYDHVYYFDCNDSYDHGGMPQVPFLLLVLGNILLITTFKCHHYWAVMLSYLVIVVSCITSIAASRYPLKSLIPGTLTLFFNFFYRELETSTYAMFRSMLNLEANKRNQILELKYFIGNVAHDLKTPLHGLAMSLDLILVDSMPQIINEQLRNDFASSLEMCKTYCSFMTMAINRTQDFAKSASNKVLQPKLETVSVHDCIRWAVRCVQITQQNIPISVLPLPAGVCDSIVTDKQWLMENILCYLSNAVKYSSNGKAIVSVCLRDANDSIVKDISKVHESKDSRAQLQIIVEDEGIGVTNSTKNKLFQPFQQTMRLAGGTGLGLYSLAKRMDALGGKCGVLSRENNCPGSQFWFSFPYVPVLDHVQEVFSNEVARQSSFDLSKYISVELNKSAAHIDTSSSTTDETMSLPTALVVEDSVLIAKTTARMLRKAGYHVDCAENGMIGLQKMKEKLYDIVIMDLQMPVMDGLEAARRIRNFEQESFDVESQKRRQFIIGVSANSADDIRKDVLSSGMDDFFPKPFSFQELTTVHSRYGDKLELLKL